MGRKRERLEDPLPSWLLEEHRQRFTSFTDDRRNVRIIVWDTENKCRLESAELRTQVLGREKGKSDYPKFKITRRGFVIHTHIYSGVYICSM